MSGSSPQLTLKKGASGVRSAMHAASQLPGRGPLMWMIPLHLNVNQKNNYDDHHDVG